MNHLNLTRYISSAVALLAVLCLLSVSICYADIIRVKLGATGSHDGSSWSNAYVDLQAAIDVAAAEDMVWVAAGTYYPTSWPNGGSSPKERHFSLKNNVAVYGGFSGKEISLSERDYETNVTILSGDLKNDGYGYLHDSDNCYHVFYHPQGTGLDSSAVLDGFTITGGDAGSIGDSPYNDGGGMYNDSSSPTLANCNFRGNSAEYRGAGLFNYSSSPILTNCKFIGNDGYGMFNGSSFPTLTNCAFSGNSAAFRGGGMRNDSSSPILTNCTFVDNRDFEMINYGSSPILTNCILWSNDDNAIFDGNGSPVFTNCNIKGCFKEGAWDEALGIDGGNNIDSDPLFIRMPGTNGKDDSGDLHLTINSPCVDMGDNDAPEIAGSDKDGEPRIIAGVVDMGDDEYMDANNDGRPDYLETRCNVNDPNGDPDGDGLNNREECVLGMDPIREDTDKDGIADGREDNDKDGLSNSDEISRGTDPINRDTDGDGYIDGVEALHHSDPTLADSTPVDSATIYVDAGAMGDNTGRDWENAIVDLNTALIAAIPGDEIWVAAGTYRPTSWPNGGGFNERKMHFSLKNGVGVYGGFAGTETSLEERDVNINKTILSGDIGAKRTSFDNCYHVFYHPAGTNLDDTAVLDGVTISGGNANGSSFHNYGGGVYNDSSSPTFTNCIIFSNTAEYEGGGMYNYSSAPKLTNCNFFDNSANHGGGMYNSNSYPEMCNCVFVKNSGSGMFNSLSSPTLTNSTFSGNSGNGVYNDSSFPAFTNCILWGNGGNRSFSEVRNYASVPIFSYCDIQKGFNGEIWDEELGKDGGNNIDADPLFVRKPGTNGEDDPGDLHLTMNSPCIDVGSNDALDIAGLDVDGEPRVIDDVVDMGADEYLDANDDREPDYLAAKCGINGQDKDTDGDGLTNRYECILGMDPSQDDSDGDGIADGQEDNDKDGLPNKNEIYYGAQAYISDTDGDGCNDGSEVIHGSDPASVDSTPGFSIVIFVDDEADGHGTGLNWENALVELNTALIVALSGDEIWVAAGTYCPTSWPNGGSNDQEKHFSLKNGVSIYGGFAGTETSLEERNVEINETILSGGGFYYHVFYHPKGTDLDATAILDGFTITGGNAVGDDRFGGGMYNYSSSPMLVKCSFNANSAGYGGGMYNYMSSPTLTKCTFISNSASYSEISPDPHYPNTWYHGKGGGMYNSISAPTITNCRFIGNSAYENGGGIINAASSPALINSSFSGNSVKDCGGGVYNDSSSSPMLINCTLSGNSADYGGGICNSSSSPTLTNCILWGNGAGCIDNEIHNDSESFPYFSHCDIEGAYSVPVWDQGLGTDGGQNMDSDPLFVRNPRTNGVDDMGDLHLAAWSPCKNMGDSDPIFYLSVTDMDEEPRIVEGAVDIGADEYLDADDDDMPDYWEEKYRIDDPDDDPDEDGLINQVESVSGTNPNQADSDEDGIADGREDYDNDGLSNSDEISRGTHPMISDTDGDGYNDGVEVLRHSDPTLADSTPVDSATIYVDAGAMGDNTGRDWENAIVDLNTALIAAIPGDEIWVAAGTYRPTSWPNGGGFNERKMHFSLKNGVGVYGGFAGTETSLEERDVNINKTILSGDIGSEGESFDNCYHVFYHPAGTNLDDTAVLDGVTISGGAANGSSTDNYGGGVYNDRSSPTFINCTFKGNSAIHSTSVADAYFSNGSGGGMYNLASFPTLINCTFNNNFAADGGGMYNAESSPTLINCTLSGNFVDIDGGGGGMYNNSSSPALTNCILWGNGDDLSANQVYNYSSSPVFAYCDINGAFDGGVWNGNLGTDGGNNIDSDPLFVRDPRTNDRDDQGNLHLTSDSPCIDAGDPSIADGQDMDGEVRVFDGNADGVAVVDIGADEYVDSDGSDGSDGDDSGDGDVDNGGSSGGCFINALYGAGLI